MAIASLVMVGIGVAWFVIFASGPLPLRVEIRFGSLGILFAVVLPWLCAIVMGLTAKAKIKDSRGRLSGNDLTTWAITLGTIVVLYAWFGHEQMGHNPIPRRWDRTRSEMRALASAIEAYHAEHQTYPAWGIDNQGPGGTMTYNYWLDDLQHPGPKSPSHGSRLGLPSFLLNGNAPNQALATLTTPIPFVAQYPPDPFASVKGSTFVYWSIVPGERDPSGRIVGKDSPVNGVGWILVGSGPDLDFEVEGEWDIYDPSVRQPSTRLLTGTNRNGFAFTYDPTNGWMSDGDIYRVKQ